MEFKINKQVKGVRIIGKEESKKRRNILNKIIDIVESNGFEEIIVPTIEPSLGSQKQICGGGRYKQGIGFAIGFDRLMLC